MNIKLIACVSKNNVIGKNNDLVFKIKKDLELFKLRTTGKKIIMGRNTFESLPGILPKREHIVLTKNQSYNNDKATIVNSLDNLLTYIGEDESYVIGGAEIYKLLMPYCSEMHISVVDENVEGDTFFPQISDNWIISNVEVFEEFKIFTYKKNSIID